MIHQHHHALFSPQASGKALGWLALSSKNLGGVSSQHEQPVALKELLQHRPRWLLFMSYPSKLKRRESL